MNKYEGQTFKRKTFVIEDCLFVNCVLHECDIFYSGGDFEWVNTSFENCSIHWRGAAGSTVRFLQTMGLLKQQQMPATAQGSTGLVH